MVEVLSAIGFLAFIVSVIVEVIKELPIFKKVPTDFVVLLLSIVITLAASLAYMNYYTIIITWYLVVASVIAGFIVAFIAMYGWDKLSALYDRFKKVM